jgi:subtilisin family serine protease
LATPIRRPGRERVTLGLWATPRRRRKNLPGIDALEQRNLLSADVASLGLQAAVDNLDADHVSSDLLQAYYQSQAGLSAQIGAIDRNPATYDLSPTLLGDGAGRVGVVVSAVDPNRLAPSLTALGFTIVASLPNYHRIEAYMPLSALPAASMLGDQGLLGLTAALRPMTHVGAVTSQGDFVLEADRTRASVAGLDGSGQKIGVLSDSFDKSSLVPRASVGIASGDVPTNVQVLQDFNSAGFSNKVEDEGRGMIELIHDLAPNAALGFATADISEASFAANIQALANAGYNTITDDVSYFDEPYFQDGMVAQAVNNVVTNNGVAYFAAAGNEGNVAYDSGESAYGANALNFATTTISTISSSTTTKYFDFDPGAGTDVMQSVTIPGGRSVILALQWDQPFYSVAGVISNIDFYLLRASNNAILASSTTVNTTTQTPMEILQFTNNSGSNLAANVVIRLTGGTAPNRLKYMDFDGNVVINDFNTASGTLVGHAASANGMAVGAVSFFDQRNPETFSSWGATPVLFNADGSRKAVADVRAKPDFTAVDGADTSFFVPNDDVDGNGFNNFFGTSAAAPHAAAVAALLKQANPAFAPAQIYARLKSTADPNIGSANVKQVGAGLIDAYRAIIGSPAPTAVNTSDGFESGYLGRQWETYASGAGRIQVSSANSPASGAKHLVMDGSLGYTRSGVISGFNLPELDEAILHLNLAGRSNVSLSFAEREFAGSATIVEDDNVMPASFIGHGNYDGVSLSIDGVDWFRIVSLTGANSTTSYQTETFNLSAIAAGLGLTLGADTRVKFQQFNATSFASPSKGIAFDNVAVSSLSAVTQVVIDDGTAQRSRVRSITVNLAGRIVSAPSSAFTLTRTTDNSNIPVSAAAPAVLPDGTTRVVLTFGGPSLEAGSLSDGRYSLSINGAQVLDDFGNAVDAAGNGVAGSTRGVAFFRFFGDSNGDAIVDAIDFLAFRTAYVSNNATGANSIYDFDGDGKFTTADLTAFNVRFNKRRLP